MEITRKKFTDVFKEEKETLTLLIDVKVKDEVFSRGKSFTDKEGLAGVNFHKFRYLDIAGEMSADGTYEIKGFFPTE